MRRSNPNRRNGGFTLVELMIAILIIGFLLAIAVPNAARARDNARAKSCITNLKHITDAKEEFALDNSKPAGAPVAWADLVPTYLRFEPLCPAGGKYSLLTIGETAQCTFAGHTL